MKKIKNSISVLILSFSLIILIGSLVTFFAEESYKPNFNPSALTAYKQQGYGSFNTGVKKPFDYYTFYHPSVQYGYPDIDGHPNLDFQKGYEFWHDKSEQVKIVTDSSGNTYGTIIGTKEYSGINSIKFTHSKIKTGDTIGLLFKWRNKNHLRAVTGSITELHEVKNEASDWKTISVAGNDGMSPLTIWVVDEEDDEGWNISLMRSSNPVKEPTGTVPIVYFSVQFQSTANASIFQNTDFDDFQLVKHNKTTGKVYDLDGKLLYDLNNLPKLEYKDYVFGSEYKDSDPNADIKVDVKDIISGKIDLDAALDGFVGKNTTQNNDNSSTPSNPSTPSSQSKPSSSNPSDSTASSSQSTSSEPSSSSTEQSNSPIVTAFRIIIVVLAVAIVAVAVVFFLKKKGFKK